jgi:hypothetical protein
MNAAQKHYYLGYAEALLYMQSDVDTKGNAEAGKRPTLKGRLPATFYEMDLHRWADVKFSVADFRAVLRELDADGDTVRIRLFSGQGPHGEIEFELASSEGYMGWPPDMDKDAYRP